MGKATATTKVVVTTKATVTTRATDITKAVVTQQRCPLLISLLPLPPTSPQPHTLLSQSLLISRLRHTLLSRPRLISLLRPQPTSPLLILPGLTGLTRSPNTTPSLPITTGNTKCRSITTTSATRRVATDTKSTVNTMWLFPTAAPKR